MHICLVEIGKIVAKLVSLAVTVSACDLSSAATPDSIQSSPVKRASDTGASIYLPIQANIPVRTPEISSDSLAVLDLGLASKDWMVRLSATTALSCIDTRIALPRLERRLADVEPDVRVAALNALARNSEERSRVLIRSVRDDVSEELTLRVLAASHLIHPINNCRKEAICK